MKIMDFIKRLVWTSPALLLFLAIPAVSAAERPAAADGLDEEDRPSAVAAPLKLDYPGRQPDASWRKEAEARIEKNRKADLNIVVTDASGAPLANADVSAKLKQHAFRWGAAARLPFFVEKPPVKGRPATPTPDKAQIAKYHEILTSTFNHSGLVSDLREDWASVNQADVVKGIDWLTSHNLSVHGYALVWPDWGHSKWASKFKDRDSLNKEITRRISERVGALKGKVVDWDVVTEAKNNVTSPNSMFLMAGGANAVADWCKAARQADPNAKLFITDDGVLDSNTTPTWQNRSGKPTYVWIGDTMYNYLQQVAAKQAPFDGIGFEGHFKQTAFFASPEEVYARLERFATFGKDLAITELDVVVPDPKDEKQAALQADYTRDLLMTFFSHPKMVEVTFYAVWEPETRKNPGALFRTDGSAKPNGQAVMDLLQKRWTTDLSGKTDTQGKLSGRGFLGKYEVTVNQGGKRKVVSADLGPEAKSIIVKVD
jgi:endo-1,4-beta-xylanase